MLLALAGISACSDSTAPPPGPPTGLLIIATPQSRDTIGARPVQALVVEVRDTTGAPLTAATMRFESLVYMPAFPDCCQTSTMLLIGLTSQLPVPLLADTTNSQGRVAVLVAFGARAGPGGIIVSVPELGLVDTVTFSIDPGAPHFFAMVPPDTAVMTGGSVVTPRGLVFDRGLNQRDDDVSLTTTGPLLNADPGGGFRSGAEAGRTMIVGAIGDFRDTTLISVVPPGVIAAYQFDRPPLGMVVSNTDGSQWQFLINAFDPPASGPDWSSDGQSIFYRVGYSAAGALFQTTRDGATQPLISPGVNDTGWPSASSDGQWVYFSGVDSAVQHLWRIRPDGSQLEALSAPGAGPEWQPGISMNGSLLAFVGWGPAINIRDLSTGNTTSTGVLGESPQFSPVEDRIAFLTDHRGAEVALMDSDGTNVRALTSSSDYQHGLDWSSDGQWIIARNWEQLVLIEVATGMVLPLPWSQGLTQPAWRP